MPQWPITGEQLASVEPTSADGRLVSEAEYAAGGVPEYYVLHREYGNLAFYGRTRGK